MLSPTGWWLALSPVDLRCGIDRLLGTIGTVLDHDARAGGAYVLTSFAVEKRFAIAQGRGSR